MQVFFYQSHPNHFFTFSPQKSILVNGIWPSIWNTNMSKKHQYEFIKWSLVKHAFSYPFHPISWLNCNLSIKSTNSEIQSKSASPFFQGEPSVVAPSTLFFETTFLSKGTWLAYWNVFPRTGPQSKLPGPVQC